MAVCYLRELCHVFCSLLKYGRTEFYLEINDIPANTAPTMLPYLHNCKSIRYSENFVVIAPHSLLTILFYILVRTIFAFLASSCRCVSMNLSRLKKIYHLKAYLIKIHETWCLVLFRASFYSFCARSGKRSQYHFSKMCYGMQVLCYYVSYFWYTMGLDFLQMFIASMPAKCSKIVIQLV